VQMAAEQQIVEVLGKGKRRHDVGHFQRSVG
jgi:hypothetical protein